MKGQSEPPSRRRQGHVTRRAVLRGLGSGAVATTLLASKSQASGLKVASKETVVLLPFEITVRQGPSVGLHLAGGLGLRIGRSGEIDQGVFVPVQNGKEGQPISVVGQVNGRAINFLMQLPQGPVFGVGTAGEDILQAEGLLDITTGNLRRSFLLGGLFAGPLAGDGGDWQTLSLESLTQLLTDIEKLLHDLRGALSSSPPPQ